jgi:predicted nucleotidyltransferase
VHLRKTVKSVKSVPKNNKYSIIKSKSYPLKDSGNRKDPLENLSAVRKYFESRKDVAFAYLFGSMATGVVTPMSDVDIAVYLTEGPYAEKKLKILGDLIDILHEERVDLVILNRAALSLKCRIVRKRVVLADNLPFTRHFFESQTIRSYMDFSKIESRILERRYLHG